VCLPLRLAKGDASRRFRSLRPSQEISNTFDPSFVVAVAFDASWERATEAASREFSGTIEVFGGYSKWRRA